MLAGILLRRGITTPEAAERFLNPRLKTLADPFVLPQMQEAVERILAAVDRRESIALYGDYDVDGVTSLALLSALLQAYGATVRCFLPDRMEEGYGVTADGLARCLDECRPRLLIALDCGTSSAAELAPLRGEGIDVIIVDHHECKETLPDCVALVNPKRPDTSEAAAAFRTLCTAGLVFKLCHALLKRRMTDAFSLRDRLDLVALGTVADIVPLEDENRLLVQKGLEALEQSDRIGIRTLMEVAGVKSPVSPGDIGFQLGPRLNAAGRIGSAQAALELLSTSDAARARSLAVELDARNRERQQIEQQALREAEQQVAADAEGRATLVCGSPGWHPGVLGIVASRLCKKYHRPALVIGFDEQGVGKGSGRSITGFSLVAALDRCRDLLERHGGHEMAAGLTIRQEQFDAFREAFEAVAREMLTEDDLQPRIHLDGELTLGEVNLNFLAEHDRLQPFGMGNAQPVFLIRHVIPLGETVVLKEKHLRFNLGESDESGGSAACCEALYFNGAAEPLPPPPWDVAVRLSRNVWRDRVSVQIQIQAIRAAESVMA